MALVKVARPVETATLLYDSNGRVIDVRCDTSYIVWDDGAREEVAAPPGRVVSVWSQLTSDEQTAIRTIGLRMRAIASAS